MSRQPRDERTRCSPPRHVAVVKTRPSSIGLFRDQDAVGLDGSQGRATQLGPQFRKGHALAHPRKRGRKGTGRKAPTIAPIRRPPFDPPNPTPQRPPSFFFPLRQVSSHPVQHSNTNHKQWPAPSRRPASPRVVKHPASSSPPRQPARVPPPPVVSRSLTVTSPVPSLFVKSVATRSRLSSSSASSPSSVSSVRLPRTSRRTCASRARPSAPFRRPPRPTSSPSSKTPTWPPFTPSVSP